MKNLKDKTALITGGASGIGKIMARLLLKKGMKVIVWDIDNQKINETVNELSTHGQISGNCVDVSNKSQIEDTSKELFNKGLKVDLLINNAGIVVGEYFHQHSSSDIEKTIAINTIAPMNLSLTFLEGMMERNEGHICNIASSASLVSNPKMAVYAASKWAVFGWSDSLRLEMKQLKKNIKVTTILPYYIDTGMFSGVQSKIPILKPESAALSIIKAIEKNRKILSLPGYIYRTTRIAQALFPIHFFDWFVGQVLGIYKTMTTFTGHKK